MKIFINPGHAPNGEPDPGACGNNLRESDVASDVASSVALYLEAVGHETMYFQCNSLRDICSKSNEWSADLFISIHCNSAENTEARGAETFYCAGSESGEKLADCIQKQLVDIGMTDRGIKDNSLYVTRNTDAPAVLVELGFISNADDALLFSSVLGRDNFARAVARGITDYIGGKQGG